MFLKNVTFHGILLDALFDEGNSEWPQVARLLAEGVESGVVRPLNTTVYDKTEIEAAFRYMAQGKHIGKVLIKVCQQNPSSACLDFEDRQNCTSYQYDLYLHRIDTFKR